MSIVPAARQNRSELTAPLTVQPHLPSGADQIGVFLLTFVSHRVKLEMVWIPWGEGSVCHVRYRVEGGSEAPV